MGVRASMVLRYGQQHAIERFQQRDLVTVKIPREDRAATDNRCLSCLVLANPYADRYQLQSCYGVLKSHFPTRELMRVPPDMVNESRQKILSHGSQINRKITLHQAAALASTSDRIGVSCNC